MNSIYDQKAALRKAVRNRLRALEAEAASASSAAICQQVIALPEYKNADTIFAFVGVDWEIDTEALLRHALDSGKQVAVPLCVEKGIMEARLIRSLDDLLPGEYDIPEPAAHSPLCPPEKIDFAVLPCVACDKNGMRLGQGGGFYDRFLEKSSFPHVAICRDIAIEEEIPVEPWDQPVECVVTETAIYRREKNDKKA